jgi:HPt (histidine-containing phosphotransfer) domain-containing protein
VYPKIEHEGWTASEVFDREQALERLGGDENLLAEISTPFLEQLPPIMTELREALASEKSSSVALMLRAQRRVGANSHSAEACRIQLPD